MSPNDESQSQPASACRGPGFPFIPAKLDDFGLTLAEFRLACHIARRAYSSSCTSALPLMAIVCKMNRKTLQAALKRLVGFGIVRRSNCRGKTLTLTIAPPEEWGEPRPNEALAQRRTKVSKWARCEPNPSPNHLDQTRPYKGNPSEGNPIKGESPRLSVSERITLDKELDRVEKRFAELSRTPVSEMLDQGAEWEKVKDSRLEIRAKLGLEILPDQIRTNPRQRIDRSVGTSNEGLAGQYRGLGRLASDVTAQGPGPSKPLAETFTPEGKAAAEALSELKSKL